MSCFVAFRIAAISLVLVASVPSVSSAASVTLGRTETNTDYVSVGLGGLGIGGGSIAVSGVNGGVRKAFLYWHGIDNSGASAIYNNAAILFAGQTVTGNSLGDAETNCWGPGSSRAFFADVTALVSGNGSYSISGLNSSTGHSGNGASLIVLFNDSDNNNNRDLVFFEGNDSDIIETGVSPGDLTGWAATLANIQYNGGTVRAQLHVGDGQTFPDGTVTFSGASTLQIPDTSLLWDGLSVPNAGFSRDPGAGLWDIHTFDITSVFGAPGPQTINFSGMPTTGDCHSLVVLMLDLAAGSAPCGNGNVDNGEQCDPAGSGDADCPGVQSCLNDCTCGCVVTPECNDGTACTVDTCDPQTGACLHEPACATGPGCSDSCDEATGSCRQCGRPFRNDVCVANAVFVLQGALDLRSCELCRCDVDSSGVVAASDALMILRGCAGLPSNLQCTITEFSTTTTIGGL